jgi:photosystem II stability/assembly factor-like uncharacterized protein
VEDGVHPLRAPQYQGTHVLRDPSRSHGEATRIEAPDPNRYNAFVELDKIPGTEERAGFSIEGRYPLELSTWLRLARRNCRVDVFNLIGQCKSPQDFDEGWEKIGFFDDGDISTYSQSDPGALSSDENAPTNETIEVTSRDWYEFGQMRFSRLAEDETVREVRTVDVCDQESCGDCEDSSDGCQRVIATMVGTGATPGTLPSIIYSSTGGGSPSTQDISTMFSNEVPLDADCIGGLFVVVATVAAGNAASLHITNVDELYLGTNTWQRVVDGFVIGNDANAIHAVDPTHIWLVGDNGYVYFSDNITGGVGVADDGVATTQNLNDVHAFDQDNVLAVGELNAVVFTRDGRRGTGAIWESVTGPEVGVTLNCCWMWSEDLWFIGSSTGELWLTENGGATWQDISNFPIAVTEIDDIEFNDDAEGFLAVRSGTGAGRILRTITAGNRWVVLPNGTTGAIADNDYLNDLAVCGTGTNVVFGGGLDDDGTTGVLVKAAA